ncbi:MAG: hypothetical protein ABI333_19535 [bacterium]
MKIPRIELLLTPGCVNGKAAEPLVREVVSALIPGGAVERVDVADEAHARALGFPGSPTIRVDGVDLEADIARAASLS